jgi:Rps23 Pro-64 3,4-dihydroxylase Tpa1-like proline 4-hydroxylase
MEQQYYHSYTCILYMNDNGWDMERDGGALRLYPGSQHVRTPAEATTGEYIDIPPINGRLLIFDSCLVHSVQTVTSRENKRRRALTLWINRPNSSGVRGEVYY